MMRKSDSVILWGVAFSILLLCSVVSADPIIHHATIVYFEQNNESVNNQISYSLDCTGHPCSTYNCSAPEDQKSPLEYQQQSFLADSGICPPSDGCIISEDNQAGRHLSFHIDYCSVSGESNGKKFVLKNYPDSRYGCYFKGFSDGNGVFYTDYCAIHIDLPSDIASPVQNSTDPRVVLTSHTPPHPPLLMKKGFVDQMYCSVLSLFGARC
jgi:hypothetical protein